MSASKELFQEMQYRVEPQFIVREGLIEALSAAQAEIENPVFDMVNPHFKNKYASLAAVRNAIIPVLSRHHIALTQDVQTHDGQVSVITTLHFGNEKLSFGPLTLPSSQQNAQALGSAISYARRYALLSALCVAGEPDEDGNAAVGKPAAVAAPIKPKAFDPWYSGLKLAASDGLTSLQTYWKAGKVEYREWVNSQLQTEWESIKASASGVAS